MKANTPAKKRMRAPKIVALSASAPSKFAEGELESQLLEKLNFKVVDSRLGTQQTLPYFRVLSAQAMVE